MDTVDRHPEVDAKLDAQRDIIRQSLDAITTDIGMAMRDVGLTFPVYITVRNSGDAPVTIATPLDPSDADWQRASAIICRILRSVARTRTRLRHRERRGDKCRRCNRRLIRSRGHSSINSFRLSFDRATGCHQQCRIA